MPSKKGLYVSVERHNYKINEVIAYFGGDPKVIVQNVIDKYLPQYCEEMRTYHQSGSESLPTEPVKAEPVEDDLSADMEGLFSS